MSAESVLALAIFFLAYILIAVRKIGRRAIPSWVAVCIGAALMLVFRIVSPQDAWDFIDFSVLFLLVGMMLMTASLQYCGLFEVIVNALMNRVRDCKQFLAWVMLLTAVLSALTLNDAVVIALAPIVLSCCRKLHVKPIPYLIGVFVAANIGCMATITGSPHNALVASQSGLGFLQYSVVSVPLTIVCLCISILILRRAYGDCLTEEDKAGIGKIQEIQSKDRPKIYAISCLVIVTAVLFALSGYLGFELYEIALTMGVISLLITMIGKPSSVIFVVKQVDWTIILFFTGLFTITAGVIDSGFMGSITSLFGFGNGNTPSILGMMSFTVILSNLVSNVPAVMLIGQMIPVDDSILWISLAMFSSLAGNLTLIGAATNIIVSNTCERHGVHLDFFKYLRVGIPITLITAGSAAVYLTIIGAII